MHKIDATSLIENNIQKYQIFIEKSKSLDNISEFKTCIGIFEYLENLRICYNETSNNETHLKLIVLYYHKRNCNPFIKNLTDIEMYSVNLILYILSKLDPINHNYVECLTKNHYKEFFTLPKNTYYKPTYKTTLNSFIKKQPLKIDNLKIIELSFKENIDKITDYVLFNSSMLNYYKRIIDSYTIISPYINNNRLLLNEIKSYHNIILQNLKDFLIKYIEIFSKNLNIQTTSILLMYIKPRLFGYHLGIALCNYCCCYELEYIMKLCEPNLRKALLEYFALYNQNEEVIKYCINNNVNIKYILANAFINNKYKILNILFDYITITLPKKINDYKILEDDHKSYIINLQNYAIPIIKYMIFKQSIECEALISFFFCKMKYVYTNFEYNLNYNGIEELLKTALYIKNASIVKTITKFIFVTHLNLDISWIDLLVNDPFYEYINIQKINKYPLFDHTINYPIKFIDINLYDQYYYQNYGEYFRLLGNNFEDINYKKFAKYIIHNEYNYLYSLYDKTEIPNKPDFIKNILYKMYCSYESEINNFFKKIISSIPVKRKFNELEDYYNQIELSPISSINSDFINLYIDN